MAFIKYLDQDDIPDKYKVKDMDNIIQIHSIHSQVMKQHYDMYLELMRKRSPLSRIQREEIAVVISAFNKCGYWITHHGAGLRQLLEKNGMNKENIDNLILELCQDYKNADISVEDKVMLDYCFKLTKNPWDVNEEDVLKLREVGFDDKGIHDICSIAAYFNFVNRIANGLGVKLETVKEYV